MKNSKIILISTIILTCFISNSVANATEKSKCSRHKQRASSQSAVKWELKIDRLTRQSLFANFPHHSQTTHTQLLSRSG